MQKIRNIISFKVFVYLCFLLVTSNSFAEDPDAYSACDNPEDIKKKYEQVSISNSQHKFLRTSVYCDDGYLGEFYAHRYLRLLDEHGDPTSTFIASRYKGEKDRFRARKIYLLENPIENPFLFVGTVYAGGSTYPKEVLVIDPEKNFKIVHRINSPLSKYASENFGGKGSGAEDELEGLYEERGSIYLNTLKLVAWDERGRVYDFAKWKILDKPPYAIKVESNQY